MNNDLMRLAQKIGRLREDMWNAETEYKELRLAEIRKVSMKKNDTSISLVFNGRTINARKRAFGYEVREGRRVLVKDYLGSIHDLRFAISQGAV